MGGPPEVPQGSGPTGASSGDVAGYTFKDRELLARALTHRSAGPDHNEQLEYLGDAVLGLAVAELLLGLHPAASEGQLTQARSRVVSRTALAEIARELGLVEHIMVGGPQQQEGIVNTERLLCGVVEAVIGAVFQDGGYAAARAVIQRALGPRLAALEGLRHRDPKNRLQEYALGRGLGLPLYEMVSSGGTPHDPVFEVRATVGRISATGVGRSKKEAERHAASEVLRQVERFPGMVKP